MTALYKNVHNLREGLIWHVRSERGFEGRLIRWALARWSRRLARAGVGQVIVPAGWSEAGGAWGNHDGIVAAALDGQWGVGEQTARGAAWTPMTDYLADMARGLYSVRVYEPMEADAEAMRRAARNWWMHLRGRPYDFMAYLPRLAWKALVSDWADSSVAWKRRIGRTPAGWEWAGWCTEDVAIAYRIRPAPAIDLLQTQNPTPLTVEQCAGQAPRRPRVRVTLRDVTAECGLA
ncbi:MAG: hypothetical protein KJ556_21980 [Gammaproteobacteria bacterium]|nr:hypothetical protein [Gammaproteobacteria bacterium]